MTALRSPPAAHGHPVAGSRRGAGDVPSRNAFVGLPEAFAETLKQDDACVDSCKIRVRLLPRAHADEIVGMRSGALAVRVTAVPVDGRANAALCRLLAKQLGIGSRRVRVARGVSSREKLVQIDGLTAQQVRDVLRLPASEG